jgi:allantoin racemase
VTDAPTILVVNCNTDAAMTERIAEIARGAASAHATIVGVTPQWGPSSAEGYLESYATAVASIDAVAGYTGGFDAVIMAGYGEHGREGMRQLVEQPVVDITEASALLACLLGHRFGVVTTLSSAVAGIEDSLRNAGVFDRCAAVVASDVAVSHIGDDDDATARALESAARTALSAGADVIVLGCAGFAGLDRRLEAALGVPVLDSVACAVQLAESLVNLGKQTSKAGPFAAPDSRKPWVGPRLGAPHRVR